MPPPERPLSIEIVVPPPKSADVPVRVYRPDSPGDHPVLVWCHGGAFRSGDLDMPEADAVAESLRRQGIGVVSVDYRLAGDGVHFPLPMEDVLSVVRWARSHRPTGSSAPISLGGASAGACLAASAAAWLRDHAQPLPRSLVLAYPVLHEHPLALEGAASAAHTAERVAEIADMVQTYLGPAAWPDQRAFPGDHSVAGFPPTLILTAERDDFRPSGESFADALTREGVEVELVQEAGSAHGFLNDPTLAESERAVGRTAAWLLRQDGQGAAG